MPDFEEQGLLEFLKSRQSICPYKSLKELLLGIFPKKLVEVLAEGKPDIETLVGRIKGFPVKVKGAKSMETAHKELLLGIFPKKLVEVLAEGKPDIETLVGRIKGFPVKVKGAKSMETAQVCSGGVLLKNINPKTMECCQIPGLYLAGEILDVDGICGGYNLQWAWSTGACAGIHAARGKEQRSCLEFNN